MAKKDTDDALSAQLEAELCELQNEFLTMPLIEVELFRLDDEPISPAVVVDGPDVPFEPLPRRKTITSNTNPVVVGEVKAQPIIPAAPIIPSKREPLVERGVTDLGAAAFLLSGAVPKGEGESKSDEKTQSVHPGEPNVTEFKAADSISDKESKTSKSDSLDTSLFSIITKKDNHE
jgi:hypothetical protein